MPGVGCSSPGGSSAPRGGSRSPFSCVERLLVSETSGADLGEDPNSTAQPSASACLRVSPAKVPSRGKEKDQQEQTPVMRSSDRELI